VVHAAWAHNTLFAMRLLGTCQGQNIVNTLAYEASGALEATLVSDALAQTAAGLLAADWGGTAAITTPWRNCHTTDYNLNGVEVQVVERPGLVSHQLMPVLYGTGMPLAGAGPGAADDMAASAVIRWRSLVAGKHHRGRMYIGPLGDADTLGGILQAAFLVNLDAYRNAQIARYTGAGAGAVSGYVQTVYSRPYNAPHGAYTKRIGGLLTVVNAGTDYNGDSSFVTSSDRDVRARVQRRREIGVGS
jgi:hypothetical protein